MHTMAASTAEDTCSVVAVLHGARAAASSIVSCEPYQYALPAWPYRNTPSSSIPPGRISLSFITRVADCGDGDAQARHSAKASHLRLKLLALQLVQGQDCVIARVVGVVAGGAVHDLAVLVLHGEVVGNGDGLVVGDEVAKHALAGGRPRPHTCLGSRPGQVDGRTAARCVAATVARQLLLMCACGDAVSERATCGTRAAPHPSSAGCSPSEMKPSTDHVLTNSSMALGSMDFCVSRSAWASPMTCTCPV